MWSSFTALIESSRNRHVPYCRRTQGRHLIRPASCIACSVAKTKCTSESGCSRCILRGLDCVYEDSKGRSRQCSNPKSRTSQVRRPSPASYEDDFIHEISDNGLGKAPWSLPVDENLELNDDCYFLDTLGYNALQPSFGKDADIFIPSDFAPDCRTKEPYTPRNPGVTKYPTTQGLLPYAEVIFQQPVPQSTWTTSGDPMSISCYQSACVLKPLLMATPVAQYNATYIIRTLRAYPRMILRKATFPSFMHPHWHGSLPEPLASCMSIAQIFASRNPETSSFVWRTIRTEQQRLVDQVCSVSCLIFDTLSSLYMYGT